MGLRWTVASLLALGVLAPAAVRATEAVGPTVAEDVALDRPVLVVTAAAPLDVDRSADALRTYLDEFRVDVRTQLAAPAGDLREELAATARIGAAARAWAVVRIADGAPGLAEIELVDRVTAKSLLATVPRPRRDEDLYRAVALKVQALLRATLAEPDASVSKSPELVRLAADTPPVPRAERRLVLETALALAAFPGGGLWQQGLAVSLTTRLGPRFEVSLGTQALSSIHAQSGSVSAAVARVPISLAARVTAHGERWELGAGIVGEAAFASIETSSAILSVRSGWSIVPAVGGQAAGRFRVAERTWLYGRAAALGVIVGQHYTAQGQPLLSLSGSLLALEAGLGVDLW